MNKQGFLYGRSPMLIVMLIALMSIVALTLFTPSSHATDNLVEILRKEVKSNSAKSTDCPAGTFYSEYDDQCIDTDECSSFTGTCPLAPSCTNTFRSYECNCGKSPALVSVPLPVYPAGQNRCHYAEPCSDTPATACAEGLTCTINAGVTTASARSVDELRSCNCNTQLVGYNKGSCQLENTFIPLKTEVVANANQGQNPLLPANFEIISSFLYAEQPGAKVWNYLNSTSTLGNSSSTLGSTTSAVVFSASAKKQGAMSISAQTLNAVYASHIYYRNDVGRKGFDPALYGRAFVSAMPTDVEQACLRMDLYNRSSMTVSFKYALWAGDASDSLDMLVNDTTHTIASGNNENEAQRGWMVISDILFSTAGAHVDTSSSTQIIVITNNDIENEFSISFDMQTFKRTIAPVANTTDTYNRIDICHTDTDKGTGIGTYYGVESISYDQSASDTIRELSENPDISHASTTSKDVTKVSSDSRVMVHSDETTSTLLSETTEARTFLDTRTLNKTTYTTLTTKVFRTTAITTYATYNVTVSEYSGAKVTRATKLVSSLNPLVLNSDAGTEQFHRNLEIKREASSLTNTYTEKQSSITTKVLDEALINTSISTSAQTITEETTSIRTVDLTVTTPASTPTTSNGSSSSGGACTLIANVEKEGFSPTLALLVLLSIVSIMWNRRRSLKVAHSNQSHR